MDKYISDVTELNLGRKINGGSCSHIYEFGDGLYFKKFEEDYQDLLDPINEEFYDVIRYLSSLKGMPYIVRALDIYRSDNLLFGYSMPIINATSLRNVSDEVLVSDVLSGFKILSSDIRVLADNYVKTEDVGGDNILFNGFMYLLDLDLSLVDKRYIPDELYENTMRSVYCGIKSRILGEARYDDDFSVTDWEIDLVKFRDRTSEYLGYEVMNIGDMKKGYQKIKSI